MGEGRWKQRKGIIGGKEMGKREGDGGRKRGTEEISSTSTEGKGRRRGRGMGVKCIEGGREWRREEDKGGKVIEEGRGEETVGRRKEEKGEEREWRGGEQEKEEGKKKE